MRWGLCIVAACLMPVVARAETVNLNVKTGLWEVVGVSQMSGNPPMPKQTVRTCLTKEKLSRGILFDRPNPSCTRTILTNSSATLEVQLECKHDDGSSFSTKMHIEALTAAAIKGNNAVAVGKLKATSAYDGKWLGADCGGVE